MTEFGASTAGIDSVRVPGGTSVLAAEAALDAELEAIVGLERSIRAAQAEQLRRIQRAHGWAHAVERVHEGSSSTDRELATRAFVAELATALGAHERQSGAMVADAERLRSLPATLDAFGERCDRARPHADDHRCDAGHAAAARRRIRGHGTRSRCTHDQRLAAAQPSRSARSSAARAARTSSGAQFPRAAGVPRARARRHGLAQPLPRGRTRHCHSGSPRCPRRSIRRRAHDGATGTRHRRRPVARQSGRVGDGEAGGGSGGSTFSTDVGFEGAEDAGAASTARRRPLGVVIPRVYVTVPVMTLLGHSDEPAELDGYGPIDAETARELAAHAPSFQRILTHPETGAYLSYGRTSYRVPADLAGYLKVRDGGCRFPVAVVVPSRATSTTRSTGRSTVRTEHDNLAHLCRKHHRLKHRTGWRMTQESGGVIRWDSPAGRVHRSRPEHPFAPGNVATPETDSPPDAVGLPEKPLWRRASEWLRMRGRPAGPGRLAARVRPPMPAAHPTRPRRPAPDRPGRCGTCERSARPRPALRRAAARRWARAHLR